MLSNHRYRGSADAVRANLENITDSFQGDSMEDILILSGHGLYDLVRHNASLPPVCVHATTLVPRPQELQHGAKGPNTKNTPSSRMSSRFLSGCVRPLDVV